MLLCRETAGGAQEAECKGARHGSADGTCTWSSSGRNCAVPRHQCLDPLQCSGPQAPALATTHVVSPAKGVPNLPLRRQNSRRAGTSGTSVARTFCAVADSVWMPPTVSVLPEQQAQQFMQWPVLMHASRERAAVTSIAAATMHMPIAATASAVTRTCGVKAGARHQGTHRAELGERPQWPCTLWQYILSASGQQTPPCSHAACTCTCHLLTVLDHERERRLVGRLGPRGCDIGQVALDDFRCQRHRAAAPASPSESAMESGAPPPQGEAGRGRPGTQLAEAPPLVPAVCEQERGGQLRRAFPPAV